MIYELHSSDGKVIEISEEHRKCKEHHMSKETSDFSTAVLLSVTTGKLLCQSFSLMHEAAEFILGNPIMTHHFTSSEMNDLLCQNVLKQHPDLLPNLADDVTPETALARKDKGTY